MAVKLSPPTKMVFNLSVILGVIALLIYFLGVFGIFAGGFASMAYYAFWIAVIAWGLLLAGVCMKGV